MAWRRAAWTAGALLWALLGGCGDGGATRADGGADRAEPDSDAGQPRLVLGTGETAFEPLSDGQEVTLHMGPQGGWHVYGGAQGFDVSPEGALLSYALEDPDTGMAVSLDRVLMLADDRVLWVDDHWERFGDLVIINGVDTDVLGRTLDLVVTLEPADGPILSDRRTVAVVDADPDDGGVPDDGGALADGGSPDGGV